MSSRLADLSTDTVPHSLPPFHLSLPLDRVMAIAVHFHLLANSLCPSQPVHVLLKAFRSYIYENHCVEAQFLRAPLPSDQLITVPKHPLPVALQPATGIK